MAWYDLYAFCDKCGDSHSMGIKVNVSDGPDKKQSIGTLYRGRDVPPNIINMIYNYVLCPNDGQLFVQVDNNKIFIVPVRE